MADLLNSDVLKYVDLDLPSRGILYPQKIKSIKIRPTKTKEEKIIRSIVRGSPDNTEILCRYIASITNLLELGLDPRILTIGDHLAILTYSRIISMDQSTYTAMVECPGCGKIINVPIDLMKLDMVYLPEDYVEPNEITIPAHSLTLGVRLLTIKDKLDLYEYHKTVQGVHMDIGDPNEDFEGLYARTIVSVKKDGEEQSLTFSEKREMLQEMDYKATSKIIDYQSQHYHGLKQVVSYECNRCFRQDEAPFDLGTDFFFMKPTTSA